MKQTASDALALTDAKRIAQRFNAVSVQRQRRDIYTQPGATPQGVRPKKFTSAESAIHLHVFFGDYSAMPQSLSKVIIHIIFSTKDREAWLDRDVRPRMHGYIALIRALRSR